MADTSKYKWTTNIGGQTGSVGFGGKIGGIKLDTAVLDRITAEMRPKASAIIAKYGFTIAGDAAKRAPVGTPESTGIKGYVGGSLRNSIVSESKMTDILTFTISDGVEYGIYNELGTSRMAARPFLVPALEAWYDRFSNAFGELFK